MEPSARGLSRADDLAHELQAEIVTGRIPLGTRLRQEDLAARFGIAVKLTASPSGGVSALVTLPGELVSIDGQPLAPGLARMLDELERAGSPRLRADIADHRGLLLALPGLGVADLDRLPWAG